jgi:allophanate hydrolase subunit 2
MKKPMVTAANSKAVKMGIIQTPARKNPVATINDRQTNTI